MSLKILILNYEYPPIGGGGGVISKSISQGLSNLGHETTVITTWIEGEEELAIEEGGPIIIRLRSKRRNNYRSNPIEMLSWINAAKKYLSQYLLSNTFDICFANFALPGGEVALYIRKKFKLPYVLISHGHDIPWVKPMDQLFVYHALTYNRIKRICMNSELNFVQSSTMKSNIDAFLGSGNNEKNITIPNGVDTQKFAIAERNPGQTLRIIFVGRLVTQKDPVTLLKAIRLLAQLRCRFELNIYGNGPLLKELKKRCVQYEISELVTFHGKLAEEEMKEVYRNADLLVAPSVSEGMSITILEALSTGLYVITTPVSGNRELIAERINGELLEIGNEMAFAHRIGQFYHQKFLKNFAVDKEQLEGFRKKYDWQTLVAKYEARLLETVKKHKHEGSAHH